MVSGSSLTGAEARRERNRREMREAILEEARRIVTAQGAEALSIRAIARNLGYSPAALYEYFRDKEAILHSLYFNSTGGLGERSDAAVRALPPETDAVETLCALGRVYRAFALEHAELYRLAFGSVRPDGDPGRTPEGVINPFEIMTAVVMRGIAEGSLVNRMPVAMVVVCWAAVHGFVALELSEHLTGGERPGMQPESAEEGMQRRNALFEEILRATMFGLARQEYRDLKHIDESISGTSSITG